jgi:Kef-type K+ transport system membrane component KefB
MTSSLLIQKELRTAPYWACAAAVTATVVTFFVPFYLANIGVALVLGALSFAIWWLGASKGVRLDPVAVALTILAWSLARDRWMPHEMSISNRVLVGTQCIATWIFVRASLQLAFQSSLRKTTNGHAA